MLFQIVIAANKAETPKKDAGKSDQPFYSPQPCLDRLKLGLSDELRARYSQQCSGGGAGREETNTGAGEKVATSSIARAAESLLKFFSLGPSKEALQKAANSDRK